MSFFCMELFTQNSLKRKWVKVLCWTQNSLELKWVKGCFHALFELSPHNCQTALSSRSCLYTYTRSASPILISDLCPMPSAVKYNSQQSIENRQSLNAPAHRRSDSTLMENQGHKHVKRSYSREKNCPHLSNQ